MGICASCHEIVHALPELFSEGVQQTACGHGRRLFERETRFDEALLRGEVGAAADVLTSGLADDWFRIGAYGEATAHINAVIEEPEVEVHRRVELRVLLGEAYRWKGDYQRAAIALRLDSKSQEKVTPELERRWTRVKAETLSYLGHRQKALEMYLEVAPRAFEAGDSNEGFRALSGAVAALEQTGQVSRALKTAQEGLRRAEGLNHLIGIGEHAERLGAIEVRLGALNSASEGFRRAMMIEASRNDIRGFAYTWRRLAELHLRSGSLHEALTCLKMYESSARSFGDPNFGLALSTRASIRLALGRRFDEVASDVFQHLRSYARRIYSDGAL